jgi:hypothetical protein
MMEEMNSTMIYCMNNMIIKNEENKNDSKGELNYTPQKIILKGKSTLKITERKNK